MRFLPDPATSEMEHFTVYCLVEGAIPAEDGTAPCIPYFFTIGQVCDEDGKNPRKVWCLRCVDVFACDPYPYLEAEANARKLEEVRSYCLDLQEGASTYGASAAGNDILGILTRAGGSAHGG